MDVHNREARAKASGRFRTLADSPQFFLDPPLDITQRLQVALVADGPATVARLSPYGKDGLAPALDAVEMPWSLIGEAITRLTVGSRCVRCLKFGAINFRGLQLCATLSKNWKIGGVSMTKGYWVAFADVSDPEGYKEYIAKNSEAFKKYGAKFLTRGGTYEAAEGKPRSRTVVIEFPTYAAAAQMHVAVSIP